MNKREQERGMSQVERLAAWVEQETYTDLSEGVREALKIHILDALGCAIGAIDGPPMQMVREALEDFGGHPLVRKWAFYSARGATASAELAAEGTRDVARPRRFLGAGAYLVMIESEGVTENVTTWHTDVVARIVDALGLEQVMFEAADPEVFAWYIKQYGPVVNLFVDHSQIVQLERLRAGIWGTKSLWGRVLTYKGMHEDDESRKEHH
jgi:hypothetical protein